MTTLANYAEERQIIEQFLAGATAERILLVRGVSGSGKTTLLNECRATLPTGITLIPLQIRGSAVGVAEVFYRVVERLGKEHFSAFAAQVAQFQAAPSVHVGRNIMHSSSITVALQAENQTDRQHRQAALTAAWFEGIRAWGRPLIVTLDTFEQATTETQEWLEGPFLARVGHSSQLRVLIAGQKVPEAVNIEWGWCCRTRELLGVPQAQHWLPVVEDMQCAIPTDHPEIWLSGVCHGLGGLPDSIMKVISALPRREARP